MPKLGEYEFLLDLPFFLYPDKQSALVGSKFGGTGFLIAIPYKNHPDIFHHIYGVTNAHVALGNKRSGVIRFNKKQGGTDMFETSQSDWFSMPGEYDIAILPIDFLNPSIHKVEPINISSKDPFSFNLSDSDISNFRINAGDDVFMIGRFVDCDGITTNQPSLRFGNISIMSANIPSPLGYTGRTIVLDMRSRTGYSGSPVFVYRTHGSIFAKPDSLITGGHLLKLLGIHRGQFYEDKSEPSAMSIVHPTSAIWEVLNLPELVEMRSKKESQIG
jgi:hypothetical protein